MNFLNFRNDYLALGEAFYHKNAPTPVARPALFLWNDTLADELGIPRSAKDNPERLAALFSGNEVMAGAEPVSLAYAGHQFGQFNPQLGDGRAHLLGAVEDQSHRLREIQLKGSGRSAFSRSGDGRCALGPAIREYVMSEAMAALGIATTRCLAVVTTGEPVYREEVLPGAVVTRIAASHIRVGTFEYFYSRGDLDALASLLDYTIKRHYPEIDSKDSPERYLALLEKVMERQIELVVAWMRVGFIHGVMNTDNTSIAGETIDYGPCAMMSQYHPGTVFSSIDIQGRYAFGNQPTIAQWNVARFAECLIPFVGDDEQQAVERLGPLINQFSDKFEQAFMTMMAGKLGLATLEKNDYSLVLDLLAIMKQQGMDYTLTFDRLTEGVVCEDYWQPLRQPLHEWLPTWQQLLAQQPHDKQSVQQSMRRQNPVVVPRNHHMEAVLEACVKNLDPTPAFEFLRVLQSPYQEIAGTEQFKDAPQDNDRSYQTFCGT